MAILASLDLLDLQVHIIGVTNRGREKRATIPTLSIHRFLRSAIARMSDGTSRRERYFIDPGKQTQHE